MLDLKIYKRIIFVLSLLLAIESVLLVTLWLRKPKKVVEVTKPPVAIKGKIAIVIDDWGYGLANAPILDRIPYPLTISVLPNLKFSQRVAKDLHSRGREIILHLPLEPLEKQNLEQDTIMTSMDAATIRGILKKDLQSIRLAKGASNHMGSKATQDKDTVRIIFAELKKRGLYFLDSYVSPASVCAEVAKKTGIKFARRDVFLDNRSEPDYIQGQLEKLKSLARVYGKAVGIGHDRSITLKVLEEELPKIKEEGYALVFISELAH